MKKKKRDAQIILLEARIIDLEARIDALRRAAINLLEHIAAHTAPEGAPDDDEWDITLETIDDRAARKVNCLFLRLAQEVEKT